jgi:hypothetical protein
MMMFRASLHYRFQPCMFLLHAEIYDAARHGKGVKTGKRQAVRKEGSRKAEPGAGDFYSGG